MYDPELGGFIAIIAFCVTVGVTSVVTACTTRRAIEREAIAHGAGCYIEAETDDGTEFKWNDELPTPEVEQCHK